MSINDEHIRDIAKDNLVSFKKLYITLFPLLCVYVYRIINDESETKDIVQESFIAYWNRRTQFDNIDAVRAFLYSVTKNRCYNFIRDREISDRYRSHTYILADKKLLNDLIFENEVYSILHNAIKKLPDQTGKIIRMSMSGFKNRIIAENLEISINTVKTLKKTGYKFLRNILSKIMFF